MQIFEEGWVPAITLDGVVVGYKLLLKCFLYCSFKLTSRMVGSFDLLLFFAFSTGVASPCNFF